MYFYDTVPHYVPGGGGFNVICFTIQAFYQLYQKALAYWTESNNTFPLIKYTGCKIKLYSSNHTDYIANYHNCLPMKPTLDTYQSTHPTIMQLNNRHRIVRCRQNRTVRKPYTKLHIRPPSQMIKKWYFQQELAEQPLFMLMISAMSLDRYYQNSTSISLTIGFKSLNTNIFKFHNWKTYSTTGYIPKQNTYLYALENGHNNIKDEPVMHLIFLGQTTTISEGHTILSTQVTGETDTQTFTKYTQDATKWGNPFDPKYLNEEVTVYYSNKSPHELLLKYTTATTFNKQTKIGDNIMYTFTDKLLVDCRYNPYTDYSDNHVFLEGINKVGQHEWAQPTDSKLEAGPYPIWLSTWGFTDWQKNRLGESADLDYCLVIVTEHIVPKLGFYVPIDDDFLHGRSPYFPENTKPIISDQTHWQPKVRFQFQTINRIASCGPGTLKLPKQISAEAHADFKFYFKLGGCGPPTKDIENPKLQPQWPTPGNLLQQPSLQSPTMPLQSFIYNFDQRRDYLTKRATERLLSISPTKTTFSEFAEQNLLHQRQPSPQTSSEDSEEETEKEALLRLIQHQRRKQLKFKQRIQQLILQQSTK